MRPVLLTFLLAGFYSSIFAQVVSTPLSLKRDQLVLHGTLEQPSQPPDESVLVFIIQGSGPTDRDGNNPMAKNNSLKMLSAGLVELGYSTFRYDKRGVGESILNPEKMAEQVFENFVADAIAWKEQLEKEYAFQKVVILGHSQGSLVAALTHLESPATGIISLAGTARSA
ncbi:MAG: alpha/beta hydrolase, partial [Bacteroidota bacterium]